MNGNMLLMWFEFFCFVELFDNILYIVSCGDSCFMLVEWEYVMIDFVCFVGFWWVIVDF